jgi:tetratricopeptide (TPR) repeat protein
LQGDCARLRTLTFTLGTILTAYCCFGVLSETVWQNNEHVNRVLCQFLLCNNAPLVWRGRDQVAGGKEENIQQAVITFRTVLQRDPQDPHRWADLGDAFLKAGKKEDARYCFGQVLVLAPRSAVFLLRVADFYFQIGENQEALPITAHILGLIPDYDSVIFSDYIRSANGAEEVLRFGLPEDRRATKSWLEFLIQAKRLGDAQRTWDWVVGHGYSDNVLAGEYAEFLILQGHPDLAASAWAQHMGARADDYDKSNYLFNGDFESDPAQSPFDWNVARTEGADADRDCTTALMGKCSLRINFAGTQNLGFAVASQLAFVRPGTYRFRAFIRTEALTTDQGIRFRLSDAEVPTRLDEVFGQFTGTSPWSEVNHELVVPPGTRLLRIEVIRQLSQKFDNKIGGVAWIDDAELEPITKGL